MSEIPSIVESEPRSLIMSIFFADGSCLNVSDEVVNGEIISKIVPYLETGPMAFVTWFAVYKKNDEIITRVNSTYVSVVEYK